MKLDRSTFVRTALLAAAAGAALLAGAPARAADAWPAGKPIKLVVPFPAGGPTDIIGRVVGKIVGDRLGTTVVVENRPGAGGNLGTDAVAKAPADGQTLVLSAVSSLAIAPALYPKLGYDVARDFTPITRVAIAKGAIVAHPSAPFDDLKGLVAYAKANPGKLSYGSSGVGTANHLAGEMLEAAAGIRMQHIPHKGTAPLVQDLLGGQLPLSIESSLSSAAQNIRSGKLKGIAVITATRAALLPDLPTVAEQGYPGFDVPIWFGLLGPANLPKDVVAALHRAVVDGLKTAEVGERFAQIGAEPAPTSPERFAELIHADGVRWAKVVRDAKVTID